MSVRGRLAPREAPKEPELVNDAIRAQLPFSEGAVKVQNLPFLHFAATAAAATTDHRTGAPPSAYSALCDGDLGGRGSPG